MFSGRPRRVFLFALVKGGDPHNVGVQKTGGGRTLSARFRTQDMVETALLTLAAASGATLAGGITGAIYAVWDTVRKTKKPTKKAAK